VADPASLTRALVTLGRHLAPAVTAKVAELAKPYAAFSASLQAEHEQRPGRGPLDFAQEQMGKKFSRVRPYRVFYFAPPWFLSPHKLRVWDDERRFILLDYPPRAAEAAFADLYAGVDEVTVQSPADFRARGASTLEVDGTTWTYYAGGQGPRAILFLHGMGGAYDIWWRQLSGFGEGFQVLSVTYPPLPG